MLCKCYSKIQHCTELFCLTSYSVIGQLLLEKLQGFHDRKYELSFVIEKKLPGEFRGWIGNEPQV